jgi:hypothetical protein
MKESISADSLSGKNGRGRWAWLLVGSCALIILVALFRPPPRDSRLSEQALTTNEPAEAGTADSIALERARRLARRSRPAVATTAEEVVTNKVNQFAQNRRAVVHALARKYNLAVPDELERFYEAVDAGRWDEIETRAKALREQLGAADLIKLWPPVHETWGAIQEARSWPAQELLDYGNAILESLRPGMVYVGGTDAGRWIPTLINETSEGERHIVLTQNAFADATYVEYLNFLYGDRLAALSQDDSNRAFQEYLSDAQKRLQHDQEFPDEPKQVRPGEQIMNTEGRIQVSGQVAVMSINEKLLQSLMEKNPEATFALQESFPFKSTYADARPLGPIMELRAPDGPNAFTPERAAESLEYWRTAAQKLLSEPAAAESQQTLKTHSHDAVAAANLLAAHSYISEAEQAYRLASQLWPANPEPIASLAELLIDNGRAEEASQLMDQFTRQHPAAREDMAFIRATWRDGNRKSASP